VSRGSSIGIATGYGNSSLGKVKNFQFPISSGPAMRPTQPPIQWLPGGGGGALFPLVNRPGRDANHSSPTSAEFKKTWVHTSTLIYAFIA
jgi:hypothetical protein